MPSATDEARGGRTAGALRVAGLSSGYGRVTVLHDVGFTLAPGTVLGISGPNGAGKSTLLKTLAGLLTASAGEVTLNGSSLLGTRPHRRVTAGACPGPRGTAGDRVAVGGEQPRDDPDGPAPAAPGRRAPAPPRGRAAAVPAAAGAARPAGRHAVRRRAADAGDRPRADDRTRVLLLDEPSQGLAENVVGQVTEALRSLKGGLSMVIVEQNLDVLDALADDRLSLRLGRVHNGSPHPADAHADPWPGDSQDQGA